MIIDPEEEYRTLVEAVGGDYISFSANSPSRVNPFDLSEIAVEGENELGQKLLSLHTLFKLMLGELNPTEEAILDRALLETYRLKGITTDPATQREKEPPVMEDLYKVLLGGEEDESRKMAERLEKYIKGSLAGIFDSQSNISIGNKITVFSTRNLEDVLKPVAYYIILDFVWTRIKKDLRRRILIVEEAWSLLQDEDSAKFLYGVAKRARKYYLGLTTISQDVQDFLRSEYGKAIVTNASIQVLLKQHPAAIDLVAETFYLSEGEKRLLLSADRGEGLFFAGRNHIGIKIKASPAEHNLITTNPEEILKLREQGVLKGNASKQDANPKNFTQQINTEKQPEVNQVNKEEPKPEIPVPQFRMSSEQSQPQTPPVNQEKSEEPAQSPEVTLAQALDEARNKLNKGENYNPGTELGKKIEPVLSTPPMDASPQQPQPQTQEQNNDEGTITLADSKDTDLDLN